jgi:enamine deaminase RidA (YjgF/YER057c/UK114 family)
VVQIRIFTTDIAQMTKNYDAVTEALAAADCRPASTMVQVGALSDPKMLLEIEAVAVQ